MEKGNKQRSAWDIRLYSWPVKIKNKIIQMTATNLISRNENKTAINLKDTVENTREIIFYSYWWDGNDYIGSSTTVHIKQVIHIRIHVYKWD